MKNIILPVKTNKTTALIWTLSLTALFVLSDGAISQNAGAKVHEGAQPEQQKSTPKPFLLSSNDITNARGLMLKLEQHSDPLSASLWNELPSSSKAGIESDIKAPDASDSATLLKALNEILIRTNLASRIAPTEAKLPPQLQALAGKDTISANLLLGINRLLLQNVYKAELSKSITVSTDATSGLIVIMDQKKRMILLCDSHGEQIGSVVDVNQTMKASGAASGPDYKNGELRHIRFADHNIFVTVGKHTSIKIGTQDGVAVYQGSD